MNETQLRADLANVPPALRARLDAAGFDADRLVSLAAPLWARAQGTTTTDRDERNRVRGVVEPPREEDVKDAPVAGTAEHARLAAVGLDAIRRGELALCVMAGGMATRMGGVVKALVEAFDGRTFLELRLRENASWSERAGRPVPLWLMTSDATDAPIREALARAGAPAHVATFTQDLGLRLTREGGLFLDDAGHPSTYAPGHGDLPDALRRSGLLGSFVAAGGKHVWIANLDNLGATIDAALLGHFVGTGADVMVEAAPKVAGDKGGIPVWADAEDAGGRLTRRLQVLEEFRLPKGFDAAAVRVFNTNTFLVRAAAALGTSVHWSWFEVEKKVGERTAVQFERLLQELTSAMPATYARVPRDGVVARFLPVKDFDELAKRKEDIRAVAAARGML
ncbi:MAG TPA: UTP--glucose-1-phosphate uridylyltransferase [Polyangiaceae bacterium]|nr:UTP--glucose-1-phosphate uridylyltransferase [Polyangiaceae bacterium]